MSTFSGSYEPTTAVAEQYSIASDQYNNRDFQEALSTLVSAFNADVSCEAIYELTAECLQQLGAQSEATLFQNALDYFEDAEPFQALGDHFYEMNQYPLSKCFYRRANQISPLNLTIAHDYALVLARRFEIQHAIDILEIADQYQDFWNLYFWTKLKVLSGNNEGVDDALDQLSKALEQQPNQDEVEFPRMKLREVKETLERLSLIESPKKHIQDWHFIQYGGAILDYFDEQENYVAGGRYVALWGSNEATKDILLKLKDLLGQLEVKIEKIRYIDERDSKIIGLVLGQLMGISAFPYQENEYLENALIVGANTTNFDEREELKEANPNQVLFSFNHDWLNNAHYSPDICGLMSQYYTFPWEGGHYKVVDEEAGTTEQTEPDTRPEEEIAQEIAVVELKEEEIKASDYSLYIEHKEHLKGVGSQANKMRYNFVTESPVPGSFFG